MLEFPDNLSSSQGLPSKIINPKFLHYCPRSKKFGREDQNIVQNIKQIESQFKQKVDEMVNQMLKEEQDTLNIIPKKANIDLKRSLQPKLDKLRRRTEKTIVSILSKKLQQDNVKPEEVIRIVEKEEDKYEDDIYFGNETYDKQIDFGYNFDELEDE